MRKVHHAVANCAVSDMGELDAETMQKLRKQAWGRNFYS
jgi:hypothetical protein